MKDQENILGQFFQIRNRTSLLGSQFIGILRQESPILLPVIKFPNNTENRNSEFFYKSFFSEILPPATLKVINVKLNYKLLM